MSSTISVVIPFQRADLFDDAIASVLAQTRPADEIIVVNDGADVADADRLAVYHDRVHIIHQENRGPAAARNVGVGAATGEWIAFLDDDDTWERERLFLLCRYIEANPDCNAIHNAVRRMGTEQVEMKGPLTARDFLLTYPSPAKSSSVMIRRHVLFECGLMNAALRLCEDYDCFLRVALQHTFHCVNTPLTNRRKHARNISNAFHAKYRMRNQLLCNRPVNTVFRNRADLIHS